MDGFKTFPMVLCFGFLIASGVVRAQTTTGAVSGVVKDESGAVLPGVSITIISKETSAKRTAITDDSGFFKVPQLSVGRYEVQAEMSGFKTAVLAGINLQIGQEAVINPVLKVGELSEKVTVTGEAALVDTTSATVATVVDERKIRDLPLNGRSFTQLAMLQEAVVSPRNQQSAQIGNEGQKLSISGTRTVQTSFLLDGSAIRNQRNTTPGSVAGVLLGVDTVREFSVVTSVASAEFGGFTGGVVNAVTRSGTNELHGSIFQFHRNKSLDARTFFDRTKPPFIRNQFGFTLGGPIQKDKTFFFGSYEALRDRLSTTTTSIVPNADMHRGILPANRGGNVGVDPRIKPYLDTYPLPNSKDNGDGTGDFVFNNARPTNEDYFMVKLDHQIGASDSLFGRYTFDQATKSTLQNQGLWGLGGRSRSQFFTLEEKKIINSSLLNIARFAFNRTQSNDAHFRNTIAQLPESLNFITLPGRDIGEIRVSGMSFWGPSTGDGKNNIQNRYEYLDTVVWTRGRHSLKFGGMATRFHYNTYQTTRSRGIYEFASTANFLRALPTSFDGIVSPYIMQGFRQSIFGFFVQDDYRMRSNLTWNLGLRYEFITNPTEVAGRFGTVDHPTDTKVRVGGTLLARNPSLKAFAPRLGFAWSPFASNKTSIRGGGGIFYDLIQPANYQIWPSFNPPYFPRVTLANPIFPNVFSTIKDVSSIIPSVWVIFEPDHQSYIAQYNLSLEHEFLPQTVVSVGYQGSHGVHLTDMSDANTAIPQIVNGRFFWPVGSVRRNANFAEMSALKFDAMSFYNAFKFGLRRRFSGGLQLQSAYTYSRSVDDSSSADGWLDVHGSFGITNTTEDHKFDRGLSNFDEIGRAHV